jgi:hypothetical protein
MDKQEKTNTLQGDIPMKITKTASGSTRIKLSKADWIEIGRQAGWEIEKKIQPTAQRAICDNKIVWGKDPKDKKKGKKPIGKPSEKPSDKDQYPHLVNEVCENKIMWDKKPNKKPKGKKASASPDKTKIKLSKSDWIEIGKQAGWKISQTDTHDYAAEPPYVDEKVAEIYREFNVPMTNKYVVCPECQGEGTHLIEGLRGADVTDDIREDPDFAEDYMGGKYDTVCTKCKGQRVVKEYVPDISGLDSGVKEELNERVKGYFQMMWEEAHYKKLRERGIEF